MHRQLRILALGAALASAGCNPAANLDEANSQIDRFHMSYSRGDFEAIWLMAGEEMQKTGSKEGFEALLSTVSRKLGKVEKSEVAGYNVNAGPNGITTVVTADTHFARGDGQEVFAFLGRGDDMRLFGWHINSQDLIMNDEIAPVQIVRVPKEQP